MPLLHRALLTLIALVLVAMPTHSQTTVVAGGMSTDSLSGSRPNIVLILADDMGFSDLGCYGGEIDTPNLDRLASQGMRFMQFTNNAKCEVSRSSLMNACYPGELPDIRNPINMPTELQRQGYQTYLTGKVHGHGTEGFDRVFTWGNNGDYFEIKMDREGTAKVTIDQEKMPAPEFVARYDDFYLTDVLTDYALEFLEEGRNNDKPFFLYISHRAPHYPVQARQDLIEKYRGKYLMGWDQLREQRFARQKELGLFPPDLNMSARDNRVPAWDSLSPEDQDAYDHQMAIYAATIDSLDQNTGRVLEKLEEMGVAENTLVIFLSDNGGCGRDTPLENVREKGGGPGSYVFVGTPWANASNTPYRKYKLSKFRGGVLTPFIAHWPGVISPGSFDHQFAHITDLPATFLDLAGEVPDDILGKPITAGFLGQPRPLHEEICWSIITTHAIARGEWKAISDRWGEEPEDFQLFNTAKDPLELNDIAAEHPEKLDELYSAWKEWDRETNYFFDGDKRRAKEAELGLAE